MDASLNPIFIIGAGRSGTNILRDVLTKLPNLITWPCDEINLVFRHGNMNLPFDEFGKEEVNEKTRKYITNTFKKLAVSSQNSNSIIVEKTCANSLRIPFLNEIFPQAKYIFIYRNGYDVTASAVLRWKASVEIKYLTKKLKFVPKSDIPYYTLKFLSNRFYQFFSKEKKQKQWGPVYKGMLKDIDELSILEVAAKQWAICFEKAYTDLQNLPQTNHIEIAYENFVSKPLDSIRQIKNWNNFNWSEDQMKEAVSDVRTTSINKGKKFFDVDSLAVVDDIIDPVMNNIYSKINKP